MCGLDKKCGPCSLKENINIIGKDLKDFAGKPFKWSNGTFVYVKREVKLSPLFGDPSSEIKVITANGYENTIFKITGKDTLVTRKYRSQPPSRLPVQIMKVISGPDPMGQGEYNIGFHGSNKFSKIEVITESMNKNTIKEFVTLDPKTRAQEMKHYAVVKDKDVPRPARMAPKPDTSVSPKSLTESILIENEIDIEKYAGIVEYFENGLGLLNKINPRTLSATSFDTISKLKFLIRKLGGELSVETEMRDN